MLCYEKIEEIGVDGLLRKSPQKRDSILKKVPLDQLCCLFMFMDQDEIRQLFSPHVIKSCFAHIPLEDTFTVLYESYQCYSSFLSKSNIKERIECMPIVRFSEEMDQYYDIITLLLEERVISRSLIQSKFHHSSLTELAIITRKYPRLKRWVYPHPLLESLPFPTDLSIYIFEFL
jgi:hypothetical protein